MGTRWAILVCVVAACAEPVFVPCEQDESCSALHAHHLETVPSPPFEPVHLFAPPVATVQISSTFGPRWKFSEQRNDFHLGIDYFGPRGTPLLAIGPGRVERVYQEGSPEFPSGGNVLVVLHDIPARMFHGKVVNRFYAVYMHADTIDVAPGQQVSGGQKVGTMGSSGDTEFVHLHFETRVQTMCSLPYQLAHPELGCSTGFDPHIHPFLFVGGENADTIKVQQLPTEVGLSLRYIATRGDLDLDAIETDRGVIGFGAREGIDATAIDRLDDFEYEMMVLEPLPFVSASTTLEMRFHFPQRPAFVELRDIYGRGIRLDNELP